MEEELEDEEGCSMISWLSACYWHWQTLIGECSRVLGTAVDVGTGETREKCEEGEK